MSSYLIRNEPEHTEVYINFHIYHFFNAKRFEFEIKKETKKKKFLPYFFDRT